MFIHFFFLIIIQLITVIKFIEIKFAWFVNLCKFNKCKFSENCNFKITNSKKYKASALNSMQR